MTTSPVRRAATWMLLALSCFSLLAIASRELTAVLSTFEILFWRSLLGCALISSLLFRQRAIIVPQQSLQVFRWHLLRNISHFGGQCAWLFAIAAIPLAELFALEFTTPLWAALLASVFMGEKFNRFRFTALALGLTGVLVIIRPGAAAIHPASLVMLFGAVGFAVSVITTRHITLLQSEQSHSALLVLFYMTAIHTVLAGLSLIGNFRMPAPETWHWIVAATGSALLAHYALTRALTLADTSVVLPIDYLRLPLITLLAWWIYDEPLHWPLAIGAALILMGNAVGLYGEKRQARRYQEK